MDHQELRQEDPISPYLYLICGEALNRCFECHQRIGKFIFPKLTNMGERVGLLQFGDDIHIFFQNKDTNAKRIMRLLQLFQEEAGQTLNKNKYVVLFSTGTTNSSKSKIYNILGIQNSLNHSQYLGTTLSLNHKGQSNCKSLITKVDKKLESWKGHNLSTEARRILIQVVTSVIPLYTISHSSLPKKIIKTLN